MKHQWWKHLKWHLEGLAWCMQGIEWDIAKLPMNITLYGGHLLGDVSSVPQLCHHPTVSGHPGATRVNPSPKSRLPATWLGACLHCIKHFKQRVRVSKSNMTEYEFKYSRYSPRYLNAMGIHWLLAELSKCVQFRTHTQTAGSRYYPCWTLALWCLGVS